MKDPSVCQPAGGGGLKNPPLGHLLYSLFPCCFDLAFTLPSMWARSFRAAGMYYGLNKRSRRIVYELLASPKATKACIFIENSTFISAAFDYWSKNNNNQKKDLFSRTIPKGFNPASLALSERLKRSLYSFPLGLTSNGLLGSKAMTKKKNYYFALLWQQ